MKNSSPAFICWLVGEYTSGEPEFHALTGMFRSELGDEPWLTETTRDTIGYVRSLCRGLEAGYAHWFLRFGCAAQWEEYGVRRGAVWGGLDV